jgi:hypothetical protein
VDKNVSEIDPEKLLHELAGGHKLSRKDVAEVRQALEAAAPGEEGEDASTDEAYSWIVIASKAELRELRTIIERYLIAGDPLTAALALETLCLHWNATDNYLERVVSFALGVTWDYENDIRHEAFKVLGEYLREQLPIGAGGAELQKSSRAKKKNSHSNNQTANNQAANDQTANKAEIAKKDVKQLRELTSLLFTAAADNELDRWTRTAAYLALCRAAGAEWEDLPPEGVIIDPAQTSFLEELPDKSSSAKLSLSSPSSGVSPSSKA